MKSGGPKIYEQENSQMNPMAKTRELGLALISLVFLMLVLGVIAYAFIGILSTHRLSSIELTNSLKAFYISEGALEIGKKQLADQYN